MVRALLLTRRSVRLSVGGSGTGFGACVASVTRPVRRGGVGFAIRCLPPTT